MTCNLAAVREEHVCPRVLRCDPGAVVHFEGAAVDKGLENGPSFWWPGGGSGWGLLLAFLMEGDGGWRGQCCTFLVPAQASRFCPGAR